MTDNFICGMLTLVLFLLYQSLSSGKDGTEYAELLRKADIALYTAKRAGKNIWRFFQPEMLEKTAGSVLSEID